MKPIFFYGSLRDRDLLEIVVNRPVAERDLVEARASGFATRCLPHENYPVLVEAAGGMAEGLLFRNPGAEDVERLRFFEELEYDLVDIEVATPDGAEGARFFRGTEKAPATGDPWDYEKWRRLDRDVAVAAAAEYMSLYGQMPVSEVDTVWPRIMTRAYQQVRARRTAPAEPVIATGFSPTDADISARKRIFTGFVAVEQQKMNHRRFDGGRNGPLDRVVMLWGDAAAVLPYDPVRDRVLLIEQFRPGPAARGDQRPWCIEVIAGLIDSDESPEACARRECEEEGGVSVSDLVAIPPYYPSPGVAAEHMFGFVGRADLPSEGGIHGVDHEAEDIRAIVLGFDEAMAAMERGEVNSGTGQISLMWLALHRARLQKLWT